MDPHRQAIRGPGIISMVPMNTTSASLLERLRRPDMENAWARFVNLYTPLLFYWAHHLGLGEPDAADLVQDVFTTLVQKLPEFRYNPNKGFRNWLRAVMLNKWRDQARRRARTPAASNQDALTDVATPEDDDAF